MKAEVPESVLSLAPGTLSAALVEDRVVLFLREDDFGLRKYPPRCPVQLRLRAWDYDGIYATALLARLATSDLTTFEAWIDAGSPQGVRLLQGLSLQQHIDLHWVTSAAVRSVRSSNDMKREANRIIDAIRSRNAWPPEQFQDAIRRVTTLYPTARSLWWASAPEDWR